MGETMSYDEFAEGVFAPFYAPYAAQIIERTGQRDGHVLDLGCGGGHLGFALMDIGAFDDVTFCDISAQALEKVRARAYERGYIDEECKYVEQDACQLSGFADASFDLVVSRGSMQFWDDRDAALREIYRVLVPGGYAYLGGGIGVNLRQTERVQSLMRRAKDAGQFKPCHIGKKGGDRDLLFKRGQYARTFLDLADEWGCSYAIVNSKGEGGWYIFCKDGTPAGADDEGRA